MRVIALASKMELLNAHVMKKHRTKIIVGVVLVVAVALFMSTTNEASEPVLMVEPERGPFRVTVTTTGELRATNSVEITGPTMSRRARLFDLQILRLVPEGTVVERGEFVAELDRSQLTTSLEDAQLEVQEAESIYEQVRLDTSLNLSQARDDRISLEYAVEEAELVVEQAVFEPPSIQRQAQIDLERARRNLEQAAVTYDMLRSQAIAQMREAESDLRQEQNQLAQLQAIADDFTILAPENGMVVYRRTRRGERITEGSTISAWDPVVAELPDLSSMESVTYVNEVDIQKLEIGQVVEIGLDAAPDVNFVGEVTRIANIGEQRPNSDAKVFEVVIQIADTDPILRPAMTTSNTIVVATLDDVLSLPLEAIHSNDSLTFVFKRNGTGVEMQEVALGMINANETVIRAGLTQDDRVYLSMPPDTSGVPLNRLDQTTEEADMLPGV